MWVAVKAALATMFRRFPQHSARVRSGFTLVELLTVITVIGLLMTSAIFAYRQTTARARDARRIADMSSIQKGLHLYFEQFGAWPQVELDGAACSWFDNSSEDFHGTGHLFLRHLATNGIMNAPGDPAGVLGDCDAPSYSYQQYPAGAKGCDPALGQFYMLAIQSFETVTGVHPDSPHFRCPGFDWEAYHGFSWVVGEFATQQ